MAWKIDIKARTASLENGLVFTFTIPKRKQDYVAAEFEKRQDLYGLLEAFPGLNIPPHLMLRYTNMDELGCMAVAAAEAFAAALDAEAERAVSTGRDH